jgi:DHA3 family macrolide efflux protein-like MFS transporter
VSALSAGPDTPEGGRPLPTRDGTSGTILSNRSFLSLYSAAVGSALGASVSTVSIVFLVYIRTGSTLAVTFVGLAGIVPAIALGLFAGVVADRYNRRRVMILCDGVRAIAIAGLATYLWFVGFDFPLILGVVVVVTACGSLFSPASNAILPRLVVTAELEDANGLLMASTQAAQVAGAALGGALITFAGVVPGLGLNALTYLLSAILISQVAAELGAIHATGPPSAQRSMTGDLREGWAYMRQHPAILEVTFGFLPSNFLISPVFTFLVVYNALALGGHPVDYAYLVAAESAGVAVGALTVGRIRARRFAGPMMGLSAAAQGLVVAGLGLNHSFDVALPLLVLSGATLGMINAVYFSTMQAIVPNEVIGRVLSIDQVGAFVAIPAGVVVGGLLITSLGIGLTFLSFGLALFVNGVALCLLKGVWNLRYSG